MVESKNTVKILSSYRIKSYFLRNRIVFAPMSTQMADIDGSVSNLMIDYYADKASGGASMVITETFHIDSKASRFTYVQPSLYHDRFIPKLCRLAESIKREGSLAIAQIGHAGRQTTFEINNCQPVAPSKILNGLTEHCRELTKSDINEIICSFADAACRAEIAGFDGIEIHGGNGYLINEFLSPLTNRRNDEYGRKRELFLVQIINAIKERINKDLIVGVRIGFSDFANGGLEAEDAINLCQSLPLNKIDYIHTSAGIAESDDYRIQPMYHEHAPLRKIAFKLKRSINTTIILTGSINSPLLAEELLLNDEADLIGMGRPLLADSSLPKKMLNLGKENIRPCIRCNYGCLQRVRAGKIINCSINPKVGHERENYFLLERRLRKKNLHVLIAGAGPAGITAALRAREMGYSVRVFEKDEIIGGLLNTSEHEPFKEDIKEYLRYLKKSISKAGVDVVLSTKIDISKLNSEVPDIFFDATGSIPIVPKIPNNLNYLVVDARSVLRNINLIKKKQRVLIIGGGSVGCELGYTLFLKGFYVTIIEKLPNILSDIDPSSSLALKRYLYKSSINIICNTMFKEFSPEGVVTNKVDGIIPADVVVIAMGSRPSGVFACLMNDKKWKIGVNYLSVGDAKKVGKLYEAVNDTYWQVTSFFMNNYLDIPQ